MNTDTFATIASLAATTFGVDEAAITPETRIKDLGGKSLQIVALNSLIEEKLGVGVPIREVMKIETIGQLADRVAQEL